MYRLQFLLLFGCNRVICFFERPDYHGDPLVILVFFEGIPLRFGQYFIEFFSRFSAGLQFLDGFELLFGEGTAGILYDLCNPRS